MKESKCGIFAICCRCKVERPINKLIRENEVADDEDDVFPVDYYCFDAAVEGSACFTITRDEKDERQRKEEFG